jgi:hypothetical protein
MRLHRFLYPIAATVVLFACESKVAAQMYGYGGYYPPQQVQQQGQWMYYPQLGYWVYQPVYQPMYQPAYPSGYGIDNYSRNATPMIENRFKEERIPINPQVNRQGRWVFYPQYGQWYWVY